MIILLYSCLIGYNNLDFSLLENGIDLFTGFSISTVVRITNNWFYTYYIVYIEV